MTFRAQSEPKSHHHHAVFHSGSKILNPRCPGISAQRLGRFERRRRAINRNSLTRMASFSILAFQVAELCRAGSILISTIPLLAGHGIYVVAWKNFASRRGKMKAEPGTQRKPRILQKWQKPASRHWNCWPDDKSFDICMRKIVSAVTTLLDLVAVGRWTWATRITHVKYHRCGSTYIITIWRNLKY